MQIQGKAYRVCIYIGESDRHKGQPLYLALLEMLKREGGAGATVLRGLAGFGANSRIHTATIITLSTDLPIVLVWVDQMERVERLLPALRQMVGGGLITLETVEVVHYAPLYTGQPLKRPVHTIMRSEVTSVQPETSVAEIVALILQRGYRSLPVVDSEHRVVGIITDGDLLRRAGLAVRLGQQAEIAAEQVRRQVGDLEHQGIVATDLMTHPVVVVQGEESVRAAAMRMAEHGLKRLPVVDETHRLIGWISRLDILRSWDTAAPRQDALVPPRVGTTVAELMVRQPPHVGADADLEQIVQVLEKSQQQRVIVVDESDRVMGIITDGDLLRRSHVVRQPNLLHRLRALLVGSTAGSIPLLRGEERAVDLMTTPVVTVSLATPLDEALRLMLQHQVKRLPVVDETGRLQGLLGRASVLHGLLEQA